LVSYWISKKIKRAPEVRRKSIMKRAKVQRVTKVLTKR